MRTLAKKRVINPATLEAMKAFGVRVREERDREGLTLEQMSERVGLAWESFQRIETRGTNVPLSVIIDIARELGVDVGELFSTQPPKASRTTKRRPTKKTPRSRK